MLVLSLSVLCNACKHDANEPEIKVPSNLVYNPSTMNAIIGADMSSSTPTISGGTPITYTLTTSPDAGAAITIDANSGVITATSATTIGTYKATVVASNSIGGTPFKDIYTLNLGVANPVTYVAKIKPLITSNCSPCHTPGGSSLDFTDYIRAKGNINSMINRIKRMQGSTGFMPKNGTQLSDTDIALFEQWKADGLVEN